MRTISGVFLALTALFAAEAAGGAAHTRAPAGTAGSSGAETGVSITLLHTNDLHSHFRPERQLPHMGGISRLKTVIERVRAENPHTLLVDGGDWSEGDIYYTEGAGAETLRMMDHLTYDVAVVGNHDWLNGPGVLLDAYQQARPSLSLIGANLDLRKYPRREAFAKAVPPYVIREVGGARIAFIGLVTYEFIYDSFFKPVEILAPFELTRELSRKLKRQADVVVVVSHNNIRINRKILELAPDVDLVVGAHDHRKLTTPIVVKRPGRSDGWLVEAGSWGRWLGRVDMKLKQGKVELEKYGLIQIDVSVPEDPETEKRLVRLERMIERRMGPVFTDAVARSNVVLNYSGLENSMGNLVTDAYLAHSPGADLALEHMKFIYQELPAGTLHSADFFNTLAAVFNPETQKTWTLRSFVLDGRTLRRVLNVLYSSRILYGEPNRQSYTIAASGVELIFNPAFLRQKQTGPYSHLPFPNFEPSVSTVDAIIDEVRVGGRQLDLDRDYRIAATHGVLHAIDFINSLLPKAIRLRDPRDTGIEAWRTLAAYARKLSPITSEKIPLGTRARSRQPDLGVHEYSIDWKPLRVSSTRAQARVRVKVKNYGEQTSPSGKPVVRVYGNRHKMDMTVEPDWIELGTPQAVPSLKRLESAQFEWDVTIPGERGMFPLTIHIDRTDAEVNHSNDSVTKWFSR